MRQEVSEEGQEDWVGEAEADEDGAEAEEQQQQQQRRRGGAGAGGSEARKRGRGGADADGDVEMEDGGGGGRGARAARRGGGGLSEDDWRAVGRAMHAGQAARQRRGEATGELPLAELQEQLRAAGAPAEEAPLVALLAAASDAFGDMGSAEAGKYASCMPNFMWLPEDKLISFMS
jgi:hypothetical protein